MKIRSHNPPPPLGGARQNVMALAAGLAGCVTAWPLGIRIPDQDAHATARGNAFAATADNPAAIYYNPAGITQWTGWQVRAGVYAISYASEYEGVSGELTTKNKPQAVPTFFAAGPIHDGPVSVGLGVFSPFGLSLEWPDRPGLRDLAMEGRIRYLTVQPVAAWRISPELSIAGGLTLSHATALLRQGLPLGPVDTPSDQLRFRGEDQDAGFSLGLLWKPHPKHSLGAVYRSGTRMGFTGRSSISGSFGGFVDGDSDATAGFRFPQQAVLGWSYRPTPDWNLEFNVDWTDWDRLDTVSLKQPDATPALAEIALPFHWRSSLFYEWGLTRSWAGGWRASAGYIFSENSVPDGSFNPLIPDSDRHIFSAGIGQSRGRWQWDLAYQHAIGPSRDVSLGTAADGRYRFVSHAVALSVQLGF